MNSFLCDTHMHFDLYKNRSATLDYIEKVGSYTIAVTNLPDLYSRYYKQFNQYSHIRLALGYHPELAYQYPHQMDLFRKMATTTRYIGEVGLDFTTKDSQNRDTQVAVFSEIVNICGRSPDKILSVHSRCAEAECLRILCDFAGKVIFHWYSGNQTSLQSAIERNYYFSINHQMILSKSGQYIIDSIPINQILIESDAPFSKGLRTTYSVDFMTKIYDYLSKSRSMDIEQVQVAIKNNFKNLLT